MNQFYGVNAQRRPRRQDSIFIPSAVIEEISPDRTVDLVTIVYRQPYGPRRGEAQRLRMVVSNETRIRDERGRPLRFWELEPGMVISARVSRAMTRSIPPQAQAFEITVLERPVMSQVTEGRILQVNVQNGFIITVDGNRFSSAIRFNVTPDTQILGPVGRPIRLRDLFPGMRVRVEHATFMTASIPPQTTAFVIQIIR